MRVENFELNPKPPKEDAFSSWKLWDPYSDLWSFSRAMRPVERELRDLFKLWEKKVLPKLKDRQLVMLRITERDTIISPNADNIVAILGLLALKDKVRFAFIILHEEVVRQGKLASITYGDQYSLLYLKQAE